ncbi:VWA domain-containing protein [Lachnospiraceae bacterium 62-35]
MKKSMSRGKIAASDPIREKVKRMKKIRENKRGIKQKQMICAILAGMVLATAVGCGRGAGSWTKSHENHALEEEMYSEGAAAAETEAAQIEGGMNFATLMDDSWDSEIVEEKSSEEYNVIEENGFKLVKDAPLSTFSVDVDTASYTNIRRMINRGQEIPIDAVRIEEMINYFHYDYESPEGDVPFSVTAELSDCPWNPDSQLLLAGLQAKEIDFENRPMSNLVFLLDVSGSMYDANKLPLVQKAFSLLSEELTENDRVSIVTYAGYDEVVLEGARGDEKVKIREALDSLTAGGSTAGEAGLNRAYEVAEKYFIPGGSNRIILATDGDLNVGISSEEELTKLVVKKREGGVHLSVLGFGMGNLKDNKMEALADNGDGNYAYIDDLTEAKRVLVEEMGGTLYTIAKDVKIQVEFNPSQVYAYRLIGYENRALADRDFEDDTVDAGEIGAGHRVTALYELIRDESKMPGPSLKYQNQKTEDKEESGGAKAEEGGETKGGAEESTDSFADELLTVNIRYKAPDGKESKLTSLPVKEEVYQEELPDNLRWAAAVAEFGMILRDSSYKGTSSYEGVIELISAMPQEKMDDYKDEFKKLVLMVSD